MKTKTFTLDTQHGGLGDVWMRLAGLYSLAALTTPEHSFTVIVPPSFRQFAAAVFGSRLTVSDTGVEHHADYSFTSLGARSLLTQVLRGQRYVTPYSRSVSVDSQRPATINKLNQWLISTLDVAGLIRSPEVADIHRYQGFTDLAPFARDRRVTYQQFLAQARQDFPMLRERLRQPVPLSSAYMAPGQDTRRRFGTLVFPSGTSRQCMPITWAKSYLPQASYAFFHKDPLKIDYLAAGLDCVDFFAEPGDMVHLAERADWCISTDSFSSHLLQYLQDNTTILMTELTAARVITPFFCGHVVASMPTCYPCRKTVRGANSRCQAGYDECLNWTFPEYAAGCLSTIGKEVLNRPGFRGGQLL